MIIDDPLPKLSSVINSANHMDKTEPRVKDKIILQANNRFQLKTTGFIKKNAIALLKITAQPNVK